MNINLHGLNANTVAITDFKIVASKLAKVVISFTGKFDKAEVTAALGRQLGNLATPVENSFQRVKAGCAVGFIRANQEVRVPEPQELKAYKIMSSNIMMDESDKSLWEVRKGASGTYLARQGHEDLSELVSAATNHGILNVPRLNHIAQASVARREFVAFASASGDMDYGFCVGVNRNDGMLKVVATSDRQAVVISSEQVVASVPVGKNALQLPHDAHARITASGISRTDADQEITYYQKLYGYDPAYLAEVIRQVEGTTAM
jgi:hypothetical protein